MGLNQYSQIPGLPSLLSSLASFYNSRYEDDVSGLGRGEGAVTEENFVVVNSGENGLYAALQVLYVCMYVRMYVCLYG
jgi:hypothetical protein